MTLSFGKGRRVKNRIFVCFVLILSATFREQPVRKGFSVHGVGLGWSDERIEALVGTELPESDCPKGDAHFHQYEGGLWVRFDKLSYEAELLSGLSLEFDGQLLVQEGDRTEDITKPPITVIPLEGGGRLVARPVIESYFVDEEPEFGWKSIPTKGFDRVFRVAYRYESDDGTATDAYDMELSILALGERVERVQLRGMGH